MMQLGPKVGLQARQLSSVAPTVRARQSLGSKAVYKQKVQNRQFSKVQAAATAYDFKVQDIDTKQVDLKKYLGKVVLVVNVASQCGFTPQYQGLQELYSKYRNQGFEILAFPCNQFGSQEPGNNQIIKDFAKSKGATFQIMDKVDVNGFNANPFFSYLKEKKGEWFGNDIKWNFYKFLIDKQGNVVGRYPSLNDPKSIANDIEKYLKA